MSSVTPVSTIAATFKFDLGAFASPSNSFPLSPSVSLPSQPPHTQLRFAPSNAYGFLDVRKTAENASVKRAVLKKTEEEEHENGVKDLLALTLAAAAASSATPTSAPSESEKLAKPTIIAQRLPFDTHRIAASRDTLRLARLWPKLEANQLLLTAIIDIAAETPGEFVLTTPTAVALVECGTRMAGYLIGVAMESGTSINASAGPIKADGLFDGVRQSALQKLQQGGWSASSPIPRLVVERWWREAKQQQQPVSAFPPQLNCEDEQCVCGALVAEWIRLLLGAVRAWASKNSCSVLTIGILQSAMSEQSSSTVAAAFSFLDCNLLPDLDKHVPLELCRFDKSKSDTGSHMPLLNKFWLRGDELLAVENEATRLILEGGIWYDDRNRARQVAEQIVRGEQLSHSSDKILEEMKIRLIKIDGVGLRSRSNASSSSSNSSSSSVLVRSNIDCRNTTIINKPTIATKRLHMVVTDAGGCEWPLTLRTQEEIATQIRGRIVSAVLYLTDSPRVTLAEVYGSSETNLSAVGIYNVTTEPFQPTLSSAQLSLLEQILDRFDSGDELHESAGGETTTTSHSSFDDLRRRLGSRVCNPWEKMTQTWRLKQFEHIALQMFPFLEYDKWGASRYEEPTREAKRQFQACVIDAAMQANRMPVLPTVLLELIADYDTIEVIPYLTLEEQKHLSNTSSTSEK